MQQGLPDNPFGFPDEFLESLRSGVILRKVEPEITPPADLVKMVEKILLKNYSGGVAIVKNVLFYLHEDVARQIAKVLYDARQRDKDSIARELEKIVQRLRQR